MRQWDNDVVLYVLATGETHALGPAHGAALGVMLAHPGGPRTATQWLRVMADDEPGADGALSAESEQAEQAELAVLAGVLADLQRIGVVQRLPA